MKEDIRKRYSYIGEIPKNQHQYTIWEMLFNDDYFPRDTLFIKKVYYVLLKVFFRVNDVFKGKETNNKVIQKTERSHTNRKPILVIVPVFSYDDLSLIEMSLKSVYNQSVKTELVVVSVKDFKVHDDFYSVKVDGDNRVLTKINELVLASELNEIVVLTCGDYLSEKALYNLTKDQEVGMLSYCDEQVINGDYFEKGDYSPDRLRSHNYIGEFICCSTKLFAEVGGFYEGDTSSYIYSFLLRATDKANIIRYCREEAVLYTLPTRENNVQVNEKVLLNFLKTKKERVKSITRNGAGHFIVNYELIKKPKVSIIIPTKNRADVLGACLNSIFKKSTYNNFEVILIDNNSDEKSLFDLVLDYETKYPDSFKCKKDSGDFNFARLMNSAVSHTKGDYYLFLNNDTEVITNTWIEDMLSQAQRESIGIVGAKLLYPNNLIQHCGVNINKELGVYHVYSGYEPNSMVNRGQISTTANYDAITGACMLLSKSIYKKVNGFDEFFKVSFNDIDLCLKIKELQLYNVYMPNVSLYHYESISRGNPYATPQAKKQSEAEADLFNIRWSKYFN